MSPELVMYLCKMNALVSQMEGMKIQNIIEDIDGMPPIAKPEHFYQIQTELEALASAAGSLIS